jgi:hypothetical protein
MRPPPKENTMSEFVYYFLKANSQSAIDKAVELGVNPLCYNFKKMSDPRYAGMYLFVMIDRSDNYVLHTNYVETIESSDLEEDAPVTVVD